jgi:DNA-3-methyladenine glycosylase I
MATSFPYKEVFHQAEATLITYGARHRSLDKVIAELDSYKHYERQHSDDKFYEIMTAVVFYAGFKAAIVTAAMPVITRHFPSWKTVSAYMAKDVENILGDPLMIKHPGKIKGCVNNAKQFSRIIERHGSFQIYVDSFQPTTSCENLLRLKRDLELRFAYLGRTTVYHFLTDIGMPVIKPDRVLCRIFYRLGVTEDESDLAGTLREGKKFANATGLPTRYIDIVFAAYGQAQSLDFGIDKGICLKEPRCNECGLTKYCHYATRG